MKKNWTNPELESLAISATASGKHLNTKEDGAAWQDGQGNWHRPVGVDNLSDVTP